MEAVGKSSFGPLLSMNALDYKKVRMVFDRRFLSAVNINELYWHHMKFLIGAKLSLNLVKTHLDSVRDMMRAWPMLLWISLFLNTKDRQLSPRLFKCPSQILRNSAINWYQIYQRFFKGLCGKPRVKKKRDRGSIHLIRELFQFEKCNDGGIRSFIGTRSNNIGHLSFKTHRKFEVPKSIYNKKKNGWYTVSLAFDDGVDDSDLMDQKAYLEVLSQHPRDELEQIPIGIDRGIVRSVQAGEDFLILPRARRKKGREKYLKRLQRRLAKQKKNLCAGAGPRIR